MKDRAHTAFRLFLAVFAMTFCVAGSFAQVTVTSANPSSTAQGTVNLNVAVAGSGFQKGAKAQWFLTGTTNPGGVTVNSTAFNDSGHLTANITVAADAATGSFDVQVTNNNGRTGKGTELFAVNKKTGTSSACQVPTPMNTPLLSPTSLSCSNGLSGTCLDSTFGTGGLVLTNTDGTVPSTNDMDGAMAVKQVTDGSMRLVAIGKTNNPSQPSSIGVAAIRYNPDGSLDSTFGSGGIAKAFVSTNQPVYAQDGTIDANGNIVVLVNANGTVIVVRFTPAGVLDTTFNSVGYSVPLNATPRAMTLQPDGKILVAATTILGKATLATLVYRLLSNGKLDTTFGSNGQATLTALPAAYALAIQQENSQPYILVGGQETTGNFGIVRLSPAGALDPSFGTSSGLATTGFCGFGGRLGPLSVDTAAGTILAGGVIKVVSGGTLKIAFARFTANGALDTTFGDPSTTGPGRMGQTILDFYGSNNYATSLQLMPDNTGAFMAGGYADQTVGSIIKHYLIIAKYDANGSLSAAFGTSGVVAIDFGNGNTSTGSPDTSNLLIQSDGKPVIAGMSGFSSGTYSGGNFALARVWP